MADKKDQREFVLFVHNIQQSLVLLDNAANSNKKLLKKVIHSRENSRRAGQELLETEDNIFGTKGEKLLFLKEMNHIADASANIADLLFNKSIDIPSSLYDDLGEIISRIAVLAKHMDFSSYLDTKEITKSLRELRSNIAKEDLNPKPFFILNKITNYLIEIIYGLEKANQF